MCSVRSKMATLSRKLITGDGRTITIGDAVDLYRKSASLSVPIAGQVKPRGKDTFSLIVKSKAVNHAANESIETFKIYHLSLRKMKDGTECIETARCVSDIHESAESASATSLNGRYLARLKTDPNSPDKQTLQIWDLNRLVYSFNIADNDVHGPINTDPQFSNFTWSPFGAQDKLLYVCQPKRNKKVTFFDSVRNANQPAPENLGEEFLKKEDWGETLDGIEHTCIGIIDVSDNFKVTKIDVDSYSLGSPQWLDNGTKVVSTAYKEKPRRLGLVYCNNRESTIMIHDWQTGGLVQEITGNPNECCHYPRVNNSGDKFLYLTNAVFGAHVHSVRMNLYDLKSRSSKTLIDTTTESEGYFIQDLQAQCFSKDDKHILFNSHDHLHEHLNLYSLESSKKIELKFPTSHVSILDFRDDIILASGAEVNATPTIFVALINTSNVNDVLAWHQIEDCILFDEVEYEPYEIRTPDSSTFLSALLIRPNLRELQQHPSESGKKSFSDNDLPTVIMPHGGPNSTFVLSYMPNLIFYARLGLKTLLINYRGSTGVNEDYVRSLDGKAGTLDVDDCLHVIRYLVQGGALNPSKLIIQGGSHGGFLACHLSCQDEFKFTSAVIRNPVVDISAMFSTTDIPDWTINVALGKNYRSDLLPSSEDLIKMYECSPIYRYKKANVPTLMLLGVKDRRVNMYQGERWVDILRAQGIETKCKVYTDNHSLGKPENSADSAVTSAIWILEHLQSN